MIVASGSTAASGRSAMPASSRLMSRISSSRRVSRSASSWMMPTKRCALGLGDRLVAEQDLGEGADRGHRGAELVADLAQERVLLGVERAELPVRLAQLLGGALELDRLLRELARGFDQPLGLVGDVEELGHAHGGAAGDPADHRVGGGGADRARELALEPGDDRVGRDGEVAGAVLRGGHLAKEGARRAGTEDALRRG